MTPRVPIVLYLAISQNHLVPCQAIVAINLHKVNYLLKSLSYMSKETLGSQLKPRSVRPSLSDERQSDQVEYRGQLKDPAKLPVEAAAEPSPSFQREGKTASAEAAEQAVPRL